MTWLRHNWIHTLAISIAAGGLVLLGKTCVSDRDLLARIDTDVVYLREDIQTLQADVGEMKELLYRIDERSGLARIE